MEELLKSFKDFIGRDLIFIITGGQVVGSFLYCFASIPAASDSWVLFVLLGGAGYFVAYAIQELFCLLQVVPTVPIHNPCAILCWIYKLYLRQRWVTIDKEISPYEHRGITPPERQTELERLVFLQQVGTAGGPCFVLSGLLFYVAYRANQRPLDLYVSAIGLVLGLLLILLAWLKAAQLAQFIAKFGSSDENVKT